MAANSADSFSALRKAVTFAICAVGAFAMAFLAFFALVISGSVWPDSGHTLPPRTEQLAVQ